MISAQRAEIFEVILVQQFLATGSSLTGEVTGCEDTPSQVMG